MMKFLNIFFLITCILVPIIMVMLIIGYYSTTAKWESARRIQRNLELGNLKQTPKLNKLLLIYISISLTLISVLLCGALVTVISYAKPRFIQNWINSENLQIIMVGTLFLGLIMGTLLWIFWNFIERNYIDK